ncbi:MAG: hypothetical protein RID91_22295 [Azospirillaceae bacterium]
MDQSTPSPQNANAESEPPTALPPEQLIAIWDRTIQTQMHFNEMSAKSRQLGLTFASAALGLAIVLLARENDFVIPLGETIVLHIAVLITAGTAFAIYGVKRLDLNVYHRMLRGAVTFGEDLERTHLAPPLRQQKGLTQAVSHYSRLDDAGVVKSGPIYHYTGTKATKAESKIAAFYWFLIFSLSLVTLALFFSTSGVLAVL